MADRLFRNEVIEASRDRLTGTVIAAVPPSSRLYTRLAVAVTLALVALLILGNYTMTTEARGIVAYDAGVARVYPREAGEIAAIAVRPGQSVSAGQPLVELALAQGAGGMDGVLSQVATQDSEVARQIGLAAAQAGSEIAGLDSQRTGLSAAITSLTRQQAIARDQIGLAEAALRRAERLAAEGAGTQRQVEDSRSAVLSRRAEYEALGEQIAAQRSALQANQAERARRAIGADVAQSELQTRRAQLAEQRAQIDRSNRLVLTSPIDGVVGDLGGEIGQRAGPDRSVVSVIPAGSAMEIWLYAPTRAVGNARPGQKVRLMFDAFPHRKHGTGTGIVTEVSRVSTDPGNVDPSLQITEPVFRIRTRIVSVAPKDSIAIDALRPGMTVSAKLELENRSLWEVLFGPILQGMAR